MGTGQAMTARIRTRDAERVGAEGLAQRGGLLRTGLRICGARGRREVRAALIRYARWLRRHQEFPVRVPVYLSPAAQLTTIHGERVSASFFAPFTRDCEPYIRIATGDYPSLVRQRGRDDCLAAYITSLSHEVIHYQQWVRTGRTWERGVGRKAIAMLRAYAATVPRP